MEHPLISIIVPVYKTEKYLNRCVKSIVNQTLKDFELILIDDGSPDQSGKMCDDWAQKDKRIRVIHQENKGAGAARNAGLDIAQGEYIGFVDSDDWIHPQMYEVLFKALKDTHAQASICNLRRVNNYNKDFSKIENNYQIQIKDKREMLEWFFRIHGEDSSIQQIGTRLIKKNILNQFRFIEGTISEDVGETYFYIMNTDSTAVVDLKLYYYYINQMGVTKSSVTMKDMEYIQAYKRIAEHIKYEFPEYWFAAYMNYIRSNFTILSKMKLFGFDKGNKELYCTYIQLKKIVRQNFWKLWKWPMPFSRKILLIYVCF